MNDNRGKPIQGLSKSRILSILKKIPIFTGMLDNEYEVLIDVFDVVQVEAGSVLFEEGQSGDVMYVLLAGAVEISTRKSGIIYNMQPGEMIGEIGAVCQMPRSATAAVSAASSFLCLGSRDINQLAGKSPRVSFVIMRNIAKTLAERLMNTNKHIPIELEASKEEGS